LGAITEREIAFLQAIQGNLDTAQSPAQVAAILRDVQTRRREFREERLRIVNGGQPAATPAAPAPEQQGAITPQAIQGMSPTELAQFVATNDLAALPDEVLQAIIERGE
jgi:hypothetical protein